MVWINRIDGRIPVALTIAGSDSGGGAGIQADLKTFSAIGVHGTTAITAITAQNSTGVYGVQGIDPELVRLQIKVVANDMGVDAAKTGMLYTSDIIEVVADETRKLGFPLVVDPVMIAKSGAPLLKEGAVRILMEKLIPISTVITPNRFEAEKISGFKIRTIEDAKKAAKEIAKLGPKAVVVKGGHLEGEKSIDILYFNEEFEVLEMPRIETKNTHGTGCSFSAAIAGFLAKGLAIPEAIKRAKEVVFQAIKYGLPVGKGFGSVNPLALVYRESEKYAVLRDLLSAFKLLNSNEKIYKLIPEVRMNLVYALPQASSIEEVAGFPGRITFDGEKLAFVSCPKFGGSRHLARAVLAMMKHDESMRSAINIKYDPKLIEMAKKAGLKVSVFDRSREPKEVKMAEGRSLPWGVREAIRSLGKMPDLIYDLGDVGKEPMIRLFGRNPVEVVEKLFRLLREG